MKRICVKKKIEVEKVFDVTCDGCGELQDCIQYIKTHSFPNSRILGVKIARISRTKDNRGWYLTKLKRERLQQKREEELESEALYSPAGEDWSRDNEDWS